MSVFVNVLSCEGFGFLSLIISIWLELCWYPVKLCVYDIWGLSFCIYIQLSVLLKYLFFAERNENATTINVLVPGPHTFLLLKLVFAHDIRIGRSH